MLVARQISEEFSGPLPHPSIMAAYNGAVTDGAERIVKMAEEQIAHRQDMERIYVTSQATTEGRGQIMAFALAALALLLGAGLVFTDHSGEGFAVIVTAIASLAGVNVFSRILEHREAGQRRREDRELEA